MVGDDEDKTPKDFKECVSQEQLQSIIEHAQKDMSEEIAKAITDALIDLKLGNTLERLHKRVSTLTNRIVALENHLAPDEDVNDDDEMYDTDGNVDRAVIMRNRLHRRLHTNTTGMGGTQHFNCHQGNHNRAAGYLDWEMTTEQKFSAHLVPEQHRVR
jgi:hypothetical protein